MHIQLVKYLWQHTTKLHILVSSELQAKSASIQTLLTFDLNIGEIEIVYLNKKLGWLKGRIGH